jgi:hypothetical protein
MNGNGLLLIRRSCLLLCKERIIWKITLNNIKESNGVLLYREVPRKLHAFGARAETFQDIRWKPLL